MTELERVTKSFDSKLKPFDESIAKIDTDMIELMQHVTEVQSTYDGLQEGLTLQRKQMNVDLETFQAAYADKLAKAGMSDADKRVFQQLIDDLNSNIAKNRSNIQLLAKELQKATENQMETD